MDPYTLRQIYCAKCKIFICETYCTRTTMLCVACKRLQQERSNSRGPNKLRIRAAEAPRPSD
jgi:hypothetical protein